MLAGSTTILKYIFATFGTSRELFDLVYNTAL